MREMSFNSSEREREREVLEKERALSFKRKGCQLGLAYWI